MAAALTRLWAKFLPEIESRVAILSEAASALAAGTLTPAQQQAALAAAHKLAGSLGTFGLHRGTELARQTELALAQDPVAASPANLANWIAGLQSVIQNRN